MVSGHAYGKALRTVKTCVGTEWCRFGTQDSTGLGVKLEQMMLGLVDAAQGQARGLAAARATAPRRRSRTSAWSASTAGYELIVGGNGGIKVRVTDLLCKVATEDEVLEYCGAFLQLYREEARYLERTAPWIERVGLDYVKQPDRRRRRGPRARCTSASSSRRASSQDDPWAERAAGAAAHEYRAARRGRQ